MCWSEMKSLKQRRENVLKDALYGVLVVNGVFKYDITTYGDYSARVTDLTERGLKITELKIILM